MSIRRAPILPPLGVGMIVTSDSNVDEEVGQESDTTSLLFGDIPSNKLGGMMRQAIDGASAWGRGSIYPRWTEVRSWALILIVLVRLQRMSILNVNSPP